MLPNTAFQPTGYSKLRLLPPSAKLERWASNMETSLPASLSDAARSHWRSFAPAWLFPFVFFYGGGVSDSLGHPNLFFYGVALPLFYWSFHRAARPWLQRSVKYWHCVFWAMLVPFFLSIVAVSSRLALLSLLVSNGKA